MRAALWSTAADRSDLGGPLEGQVALATYSETALSPESVAIMNDLRIAHPLVQPLPGGQFLVAIRSGYFDEGIFGNLGWGAPGPTPLGSSGLVRWSATFEKLWEYPGVDATRTAPS